MRRSSRDTASAGSSSRCRSPSTNHSAIVSPGCWRAMIHTGCAPVADDQPVEIAPLQAAAEPLAPGAACHAVCQQRKVPFPRIRLEVRDIHRRNRRQVDRHRPAVVTRRQPSPAASVARWPPRGSRCQPVRIRRVAGVGEIAACAGRIRCRRRGSETTARIRQRLPSASQIGRIRTSAVALSVATMSIAPLSKLLSSVSAIAEKYIVGAL